MFDELVAQAERDFDAFAGLLLERYFRAKFLEESRYTTMGGWWDRKGENEIDLVCENEFKGTIDFFEVKRDAKRYDRKLLEEKVEAFFAKNPKKRKLEGSGRLVVIGGCVIGSDCSLTQEVYDEQDIS